MLYIYYGTDIAKARAKVRKTVDVLRKKQPDALYLRVYGDEFLAQNPTELVASQGLFKSEYIVLLDSILVNADAQKMFFDMIQALAQAPHIFLLLQDALSTKLLTKLEKHATKIESFDRVAKEGSVRENAFAITDALLARNKSAVWNELQQQYQSGKPAEEIAGVLFWAAKSIVLGHTAGSAQEAGLKPYPFKKAQSAAQHFTKHEARQLLAAIAGAQAKAFVTGAPLSLVLEEVVLSI